jgi:hypothetical protein
MAAFQDYYGTGATTAGGHYRAAFKSGAVTGLTAGQAMFCLRWTAAALFFRLFQLRVSAVMTTAFGTAQASDIALSRATGWATAPTAGVSLTNFKSGENAMADSGVINNMANLVAICPAAATNIVIANTGALTTGSPTIDGNPIASDVFNIIALGSADTRTLYDCRYGNEYPLTLGQNEGIILSVPTAQGSSGVVVYHVNMTFAVNNLSF